MMCVRTQHYGKRHAIRAMDLFLHYFALGGSRQHLLGISLGFVGDGADRDQRFAVRLVGRDHSLFARCALRNIELAIC